MADTELEENLGVGAGNATLAAAAGVAALVASIVGLTRAAPLTMLEIATLLVGAGLAIEGSALLAWWMELGRDLRRRDREAIGGGITAEVLGGTATMVLGLIALLGHHPFVLLPTAAVVAGGALLMGGGAQERARQAATESERPASAHEPAEEISRAALGVATAADVLVGLGAVVLGVLGLLDLSPLILSLVAMLSLGVALFVGGGAVGTRLAQLLSWIG